MIIKLIEKTEKVPAHFEIKAISKEEMEVIQLAILEYRDKHIKTMIQIKKEDLFCVEMFNAIDVKLDQLDKDGSH